MRLEIFNENDKVLLLGEGNFSFSVALNQHNLKIKLFATCYECLPINETAVKNIEILKSYGISVLLGVDGTNLSENCNINNKTFDKIIFNFPHVCSKMRLDLNRELLQKFFQSAEKLLESNGKVLVTLCNGQGGTSYDNPQRRWDDSWKIKEMAAYGNFVLTSIEPFLSCNFENYFSTGFRGQDKVFFSDQAVTHIFEKTQSPNVAFLKPFQPIDVDKIDLLTNIQTWDEIIPKDFHKETFGPPVFFFDITFTTTLDFKENIFYIILYNNVGRIIKNITFLRLYQFPNSTKVARTYRICYHADDVPLYRKCVIDIHNNLILTILRDNLDVII